MECVTHNERDESLSPPPPPPPSFHPPFSPAIVAKERGTIAWVSLENRRKSRSSGYEPRIIENAIPSLDTYFAKSSELLRLNANPIRDRFKPRFSRDKWDFSFFFFIAPTEEFSI